MGNLKEELFISDRSFGSPCVVTAEQNTTVNGYQVPQLTGDQLVEIYNASVIGKPVTVIDATGMMYFQGINADVVSEEIFVSFRYFTAMILEYSENGTISFVSLQ